MKSRYFQVSLGCRVGLPRDERSREEGLNKPINLEK